MNSIGIDQLVFSKEMLSHDTTVFGRSGCSLTYLIRNYLMISRVSGLTNTLANTTWGCGETVDTLGLEPSDLTVMGVQIPPALPIIN